MWLDLLDRRLHRHLLRRVEGAGPWWRGVLRGTASWKWVSWCEFEKDALQCLETRCSVMASLVMKYLIDFWYFEIDRNDGRIIEQRGSTPSLWINLGGNNLDFAEAKGRREANKQRCRNRRSGQKQEWTDNLLLNWLYASHRPTSHWTLTPESEHCNLHSYSHQMPNWI